MTCGYWLGQPGHLMHIDGGHGQLVRSWDSHVTIHDGGAAPKYAHINPRRGGRVWAVGLEHSQTREISNLHEVALLGVEVMMVDPWAQVTNVLTPEASLVQAPGLERVGGFDLADGGHVASAALNSTATAATAIAAGDAPVLPGGTVTASMWLASAFASRVRVRFLDADQNSISVHDGPAVTGMDRMRRSTVTATAPAGAVAARVGAVGGQYHARAALTWTDTATEWGIGGVALRAVVHEVRDDIAYAVPGASESLRRAHAAFTVTELGA